MNNNLKTDMIDAVILCGGRGERLQPAVSDRPKPLAEIDGRPFLDILIGYVASFGFKRFILCTGYMGNKIRQYYQKAGLAVTILFSEEKEPLGTAGAIKNAQAIIKSNPLLVMNGDSFCQLDLNVFLKFHMSNKSLCSVALVKAKQSADYGVVTLDSTRKVIRFDEKVRVKPGDLINAGIYLFERSVFSLIPSSKGLSLEYELFPEIIKSRTYGYVTGAELIDIGTPERYKEAQAILRSFS